MAEFAAFDPITVIGSEFIAPYPFDIMIDKSSAGQMVITDMNHKLLLTVKPCNTTFHNERAIYHADGTLIVRLRDKILSEHSRWKAYRGDSKADKDMIFSTKEPNMIQYKTSLQVFLANKTSTRKGVCDFKMKGSWSKRECKIYMGDSDDSDSLATIAPMQKEDKSKKAKLDKNKYMVTIYPNVDYAFVVALIAILDAMKSTNESNATATVGAGAQIFAAVFTG